MKPLQQDSMMQPILCTPAQAQKLIGAGKTFLYARLADGSIKSFKAGPKKRMIFVASIVAWCEAQQKQQGDN